MRKLLDGDQPAAHWPAGIGVRTLNTPADAKAVHALLLRAYDGDEDIFPSAEDWWARFSGDPEFDRDLCLLAFDTEGQLAGVALCWTSAFVKDLAVRADMRRQGLGEALLLHVFSVFRARGAAHVDLKVELDNEPGLRLYRRCGMVHVPWEG
ncbi:GNAT family N-acetyltransferase [Mesorhizobium sp. LHD-90]|uniref:GNAT family N-acetyltransferase n=1 Tax=Mesorhizobium sp. LHD-90 TaxID=3071414 RepID=UPI0027E0AC21|nr:GNAT family N-acetyltransferase [Mesorhizobium sp. LHD-90]MDQ6435718.1 GNAT family N-acetyltransferase [Mesorhizobium sp. LHD-90]